VLAVIAARSASPSPEHWAAQIGSTSRRLSDPKSCVAKRPLACFSVSACRRSEVLAALRRGKGCSFQFGRTSMRRPRAPQSRQLSWRMPVLPYRPDVSNVDQPLMSVGRIRQCGVRPCTRRVVQVIGSPAGCLCFWHSPPDQVSWMIFPAVSHRARNKRAASAVENFRMWPFS
jgi:hypothetical protein